MASVPGFLTGPLERVEPSAGATQVLVITADPETAVALAEAVLRLTGPAGIELLPITNARRAGRLMAGRPVLAAAGSPRDLRDLVRGSHLKLEAVSSVVLAWADEILAGDAEDIEALEAIMSELPKDAARIVVTSRAEGRVNAFAERYLRRAHREVAVDGDDNLAPVAIQYVTVSAGSRPTALRRLIDDMDPPSAVVIVADDPAEQTVSGTLKLLGYNGESAPVRVSRGEVQPSTHSVIFYEPPASRAQLTAIAAAAPVVVVALTDRRELPALRRLAGGEVKPFTLAAPGNAARDKEAAMRRELSGALDAGIAAREILALEPLLEQHDGIEIAAAALRLLERERTLRKSAQEESRLRQEAPQPTAARPERFERRPPEGRDGPRGDRRPSPGGASGGRGYKRDDSRGGHGGASRGGGDARGRDRDSGGSRRPAGDRPVRRDGPPRGDRPQSPRPPRRDR